MAARAFSVILKSSLVESLSQASFSSRSYTSVKHSLSPIASHYALGKEFTKAGAFLGSGIVSRSLTCSPGLGSIVAQPHCQASLGSSWISQSARSYSTSGMYPNIRLRFQKLRRDRRPIMGSVINDISFGKYGLQALEPAWISTKQITAAQLAIKRNIKGGKIFLRVFPHKPISQKPAETRMGKGKGAIAYWAARVRTGRILFEIDGVPEIVAQRAITVAGSKLPIKTKFVKSSG